jgi:hypothetical protein
MALQEKKERRKEKNIEFLPTPILLPFWRRRRRKIFSEDEKKNKTTHDLPPTPHLIKKQNKRNN